MTKLHTLQILSPEDQFARRVTARLSEGAADLPHDISERLRIARMQALAHRKAVVMRTATVVASQGGTASLTFGNDSPSWWNRFASALPLVALVAGLLTIYVVQDDNRADELAEVDSALLSDDLPTAAYTDPGFVEFLKSNRDNNQ
ncbi:Protein of unknown function [Rhodoferax sp. OV413]|uniref:DUF3619 family protein n=1 Tax=Rhodoferax sp. OV413 TaxID=1855285 RepID=UPI00087EC463|nr:DUF3619 family protein [Rhodoferax sp. OV413]SDN97686.1 Protein of unknown function [Rhodoferax sp. OV413]